MMTLLHLSKLALAGFGDFVNAIVLGNYLYKVKNFH